MNRLAVILFALAILLAHALAIHQTMDGAYAAPYDFAHVCYRIARNLVREGTLAWNPGEAVHESYPSQIWIAVAAVAERFSKGPNQLTQTLGTVCVLISVVVLAQFSSKRVGGLIAPVLLAVSGSVAAACGSGTEAGLAMLLVTTAALAFERGLKPLFAVVASILVWTRPEAILFVALAALLEAVDRPKNVFGTRRPSIRSGFLAPVFAWLLLIGLRRLITETWLSPIGAEALRMDQARLSLGLSYLKGFFLCSGSALLVVLPVIALLTGQLSGTGRRMLLLAVGWASLIAWGGGDPLPFWNALVPVLPLVFLAIQESITGWLDRRPSTAPLFWALLVLGVGSSLLVSRMPTDIGPFRIERWHRAWMEPGEDLQQAYARSHGRLGLVEEIRETERLRTLGVYLRDRTQDPAVVATYWPGSIGYLSRKRVVDILGRATPLRDERTRSWRGGRRVDLVHAFQEGVDYVVSIAGPLNETESPADRLRTWLGRFDVVGNEDQRVLELLASVAAYELLAVPVPSNSRDPRITSQTPFFLMRDRARQEAPKLSVKRKRDGFEIRVQHDSNQQVADLSITLVAEDGTEWNMRPTGEFVRDSVVARASLLIYAAGKWPILLASCKVPKDLRAVRLIAQLHNPGTQSDVPLAAVGTPATIDLR